MKQIIITGGYSGIGLELTKLILKDNHKAGLIVRNEAALINAKKELQQFNLSNADFFIADLSKQEDVLNVAKSIANKWQKVDVLFNNAGVMLGEKMFSTQQNEMHYEVNTLAPYLLTTSLQQALANAGGAIVVNTVTDGLNIMKKLKTEELINPQKFKKLIGAYLQSKLAQALLMNDLASEWKRQNIRILNVSPGGNKTKLSLGSGMPFILKPVVKLFYKKTSVGAAFLYRVVSEDKFKNETGVFIQKNKIEDLKVIISDEQKLSLLKGIKLRTAKTSIL